MKPTDKEYILEMKKTLEHIKEYHRKDEQEVEKIIKNAELELQQNLNKTI